MEEWVDVVVGRLGRAHGIRGEVVVEVLTDVVDRRFTVGARLTVTPPGTMLELATVRQARGRLIVSFVGYPDRTAVERLIGSILSTDVPAEERPGGPEEYFDRQLTGLSVFDHTGRRIGTVSGVLHLPAQDVLSLDVDGEERLVPFVRALVPEVDLQAGHVRLAEVGGLVDDEDVE